jgi:hypothetical protein
MFWLTQSQGAGMPASASARLSHSVIRPAEAEACHALAKLTDSIPVRSIDKALETGPSLHGGHARRWARESLKR